MSVLDIDDVKRHLRIAVDTFDPQIRATIDAAEDAIAAKCGPLTPTEVTERINSNGGVALILNTTPVISLTSVTPVGAVGSYDVVNDVQVHGPSGVIEWVFPGYFVVGRYDVVYQAGRETCPAGLLEGAMEYVRYLWEPQRGGGSSRVGSAPISTDPTGLGRGAAPAPGAGIERLRRVQDLIRPYVQVGN